jgi:hypothetical protein
MQDKLLGYLLGALEIDETLLVEQSLAQDAEARSQLEILRLALSPLETVRCDVEAPAGLAIRTCQCIREVHLKRET